MDIRQLQYLAALVREKHFTRAAQACNITQPTLSGRIRQLEQELGVPIVTRGQRYIGLTQEGERVLKWAHLILDNWQGMADELRSIKGKKGDLVGRMIMGVIPSALPMISFLTRALVREHAGIDYTILSHSSEEILRGLHDFSIDAGVTYLDNEPIDGLIKVPLYSERYCLFISASHAFATRQSVTWFEAAQESLCLLTTNMQNRRIIDQSFARANCHPAPRIETNSIVNLMANVRIMGLASIMPEYFLNTMGPMEGIRAVPLTEPLTVHEVGLVAMNREPLSPLLAALMAAAKRFGQQIEIK